jgi:hypothetical protein
VNPEVAAAVERLRGDGVLEDRPAELFGRVARRELVSVRVEIRAALYLGVLLLSGGVGLFVKENHERIGPAAVGVAIGLGAAACLAWAARHSAPFAWGESAPGHAGFDYVLLLGALLAATDLAYLETQFKLLGPDWAWHLLVVAVFYGLLAYRFDSKMLLSLARASFAAWRGIAVSVERASLGRGNPERLRYEALLTGVVFAVLGLVSVRAGKKAHFEDVYVNAGLLISLGGLLSGVFGRREGGWGGWLLALLLGSTAVALVAFRKRRTLPFALAILAAWLGLQRLVFEGSGAAPAGALLISAMTAAVALGVVFAAHRKMKSP